MVFLFSKFKVIEKENEISLLHKEFEKPLQLSEVLTLLRTLLLATVQKTTSNQNVEMPKAMEKSRM